MSKKIILASVSPRRKQLLEQIGFVFDVIPSDVDEDNLIHHDPLKNIEALALHKAQDAVKKVQEGIVIAADTQILINEEAIGKPVDRADALNMLSMMSGKTHKVITGVAILATNTASGIFESIRAGNRKKDSLEQTVDKLEEQKPEEPKVESESNL